MIVTLSGIFVGDWAMAKVLGVLVAALVAWGSAAQADEHGRWQQLENNPSCVVWNGNPQSNETVTWSGACVNGKARGRGAQVWRYLEDEDWKESKYTGEMKDGKRTGRGVYVWASGDRYEGEYRDGKQHGRGVLVFGPNSKWAGDRYEGDWKDGKRTGRGVYVKANGDRYDGDWKNNKFHGRGVYVWTSGSKYEGDFRNGKEHGRGVYVTANGDECEGDWREGRLLGTGEAVQNGQLKKCYLDGNTIQYTD